MRSESPIRESCVSGHAPVDAREREHMLEETSRSFQDLDTNADPAMRQSEELYKALTRELYFDIQGPCLVHKGSMRIECVYSVTRAISGTPL